MSTDIKQVNYENQIQVISNTNYRKVILMPIDGTPYQITYNKETKEITSRNQPIFDRDYNNNPNSPTVVLYQRFDQQVLTKHKSTFSKNEFLEILAKCVEKPFMETIENILE